MSAAYIQMHLRLVLSFEASTMDTDQTDPKRAVS